MQYKDRPLLSLVFSNPGKFDRNYGVAEDPWNHTHCTQSTTTNFEGRSASCAQLLKHRETRGVKLQGVARGGACMIDLRKQCHDAVICTVCVRLDHKSGFHSH